MPSDLLIFSPDVVIHPLCSQYDAKPNPAARDCACSFSWCGNRRSTPPPWMSKAPPRYFSAIAEHSMCHPGRPGPHGEGQAAVSGSDAFFQPFQSAKSRGSRLPRGSASSAASMSSMRWCVSSPYDGHDRTSKYTSPEPSSAGRRARCAISRVISSIISGTCPVAAGS